MVTIPSSIAVAAELSGLLAALSSAPMLLIRDVGGAVLATQVLPTPVIFNQQIVLLGLPAAAVVSSQAPVGSVPFSADINNIAGLPVITGLAIRLAAEHDQHRQLGGQSRRPARHFGRRDRADMSLHPSSSSISSQPTSKWRQRRRSEQRRKLMPDVLDQMLPEGPDKTFVMRAHRSNTMWANVAITRLPDGTPRP